MNLRIAANTFAPALLALKEKGYTVICKEGDDENNDWIATKNDIQISATNPVELFGLVSVAEIYGENWNKLQMSDDEYLSYMQG